MNIDKSEIEIVLREITSVKPIVAGQRLRLVRIIMSLYNELKRYNNMEELDFLKNFDR